MVPIDLRDAGALVLQGGADDRPTLPLLTDAVFRGHADVLEEDFVVEVCKVIAGKALDRTHLDAGCVQGNQ